MIIKELIEKLQKVDPELEVYFRSSHVCGNIKEVDKIELDTYGFFGESIPCIILDWRKSDDDISDKEIK